MIGFVLNGVPRRINDPGPTRTLLAHLRLSERLTATKEGCAEGDCGACTVVLGTRSGDGLAFRAVNSCILPLSEIDGKIVLTAEGVAEPGALHPAQQALIAHHGSQCGFCTPGFVMSLFAYAEAGDARPPVHEMLAGNLCRCTGYRPIVVAAEAACSAHHESQHIAGWRQALDALPVSENAAPASLAALDAALAANPEARLLAGGTDLGVGIAKYGQDPGTLIPIRKVAELRDIGETEAALIIGAGACYTDILPWLDRLFPAFAAMLRRIGSVQIRNIATMGGNLCNASPIGDSAPCLIALGATLTLRSASGSRSVPVEGFFTGYRKTLLRAGEYLAAITIPKLRDGESFHAYKLAKRFEQDVSSLAAAARACTDAGMLKTPRIAFGGMAATPLRAPATEAALLAEADADALAKALAADFSPLSDFRGSAAYRRQAALGLMVKLRRDIVRPGDVPELWKL